jgi:hypothetical protein
VGCCQQTVVNGVAKFPEYFTDTSTILITSHNNLQEKANFNPFSFFKPFNMVVWLATIVTIVFTALMYRMIEQVYGNSTDEIPVIHIFEQVWQQWDM